MILYAPLSIGGRTLPRTKSPATDLAPAKWRMELQALPPVLVHHMDEIDRTHSTSDPGGRLPIVLFTKLPAKQPGICIENGCGASVCMMWQQNRQMGDWTRWLRGARRLSSATHCSCYQ